MKRSNGRKSPIVILVTHSICVPVIVTFTISVLIKDTFNFNLQFLLICIEFRTTLTKKKDLGSNITTKGHENFIVVHRPILITTIPGAGPSNILLRSTVPVGEKTNTPDGQLNLT